MRKEEVLLGVLYAYRTEVRSFTDKQIALLQNFAAQAVIAMENARLITETREALEQQTATAEVLQVINASPGDLAPVFDAILEKAHSLCGAEHGALATFDGEYFRAVALRAMPEPFGELLRQPFRSAAAGSAQRRLLQGERLIHIPDVRTVGPVTPIQHAALEAGIRTLLMVPLRQDDRMLGYITATRLEVRPFTDKQIALLQNFAAQAVIAMENARLLTETQEALEQQTATAEVLGVINSSPGNLTPVFDAILEKARQRTGAIHGDLWTYDGECFHLVATHGEPGFSEWLRQQGPMHPWAGSGIERLLKGEDYVHLDDALDDDGLRLAPEFLKQHKIAGIRTVLAVPLRKEGIVLGLITVYRREVLPFTDKADCSIAELRCTGGDRDRERAAADRDTPAHCRSTRIARISDRDQRRAERHQPLDRRCATGAGHSDGDGSPALRRRYRKHHDTRGRGLPPCGEYVQCSGSRVLGDPAPAKICPRSR